MKTLNRLTFFFVSICTIVLFISCLGKDNEKTGKDDETVTATVSETPETSEQEAVQPPEHPEGLEFVDVVPGEWDWPTKNYLQAGTDIPKLDEGYFRFKNDFTIEMDSYIGQFSGNWSYNPDNYVFQYEYGTVALLTRRYRVISYNKNELVLLIIVDPEERGYYSEEELTVPIHWKRWN